MIYLIVFILLSIFTYHFDYCKKQKYKLFSYTFILILLILIAGFRYRLGVDSIRYENNFKWVPTLFDLQLSDFEDSKFDPLYFLLSSFAKTLCSDFWCLQLLQACLVNIVIFRFIRKNTENIFFSVLFYYSFLYINFMYEVMREACAVSMFLLSWKYFVSNSWLKYYLYCILAFLFHSSAILLFLLPIFKWIGVLKILSCNKKTFLLLLLVLFIGYYIQQNFFDYIEVIALTERLSDKIEDYVDSDLSGQILNIFGILSTSILYIIYPYIAAIAVKRQKHISFLPMESMVFLCFVFALLSIPISIFYRYNNYFMLYSIIVVANFIYSERVYLTKTIYFKCRSFLFWVLILFPMFFLKFYGYTASVKGSRYKEYMKYYPYSSIFSKKMDKDREAVFSYYIREEF